MRRREFDDTGLAFTQIGRIAGSLPGQAGEGARAQEAQREKAKPARHIRRTCCSRLPERARAALQPQEHCGHARGANATGRRVVATTKMSFNLVAAAPTLCCSTSPLKALGALQEGALAWCASTGRWRELRRHCARLRPRLRRALITELSDRSGPDGGSSQLFVLSRMRLARTDMMICASVTQS
jgi:hypothetical protein